jgi:hypothetical protein
MESTGLLATRRLVKRAVMTRTLTGGGTVARVDPYLLFDTIAGQPIDFTLRIACPQEELGTTATSPMLSSGAATSRGEDLMTVPDTVSRFLSQIAGTVLAEFVPTAAVSFIQSAVVLDDGTGTNRIVVGRSAARQGRTVCFSGADLFTAMLSTATANDGALARLGFTWRSGDASQSLNGEAAQTISNTFTHPTVNRMVLGNQSALGRALNGTFRAVRYRGYKTPTANAVALGSGLAPTVGDRLLISGTPTVASSQTLAFSAANDVGSDDQTLQLIINPVAASSQTGGWSKWLTR